jgi:uncharacterized protein
MDETDIFKLHQKYTHGKYADKVLEIGWNHSLIIKEISLQIAAKLEKAYSIKINKRLMEAGALTHDIGFYDCFDDGFNKIIRYALHGKMGYDILKKENYSEDIARFALTHVGVGITKEIIEEENLDLPKTDFIPISLEEEIVCYADNFHSKGHPRFNTYEENIVEMKRYPGCEIIFERFVKKFGVPNLEELNKKYKKWHQNINEWVNSIRQ